MSVRACPSKKDRRLAADGDDDFAVTQDLICSNPWLRRIQLAFMGQNAVPAGQSEGRRGSTWELEPRIPRLCTGRGR